MAEADDGLSVMIYARAALSRARQELQTYGAATVVIKDCDFAIVALDTAMAKRKPKAVHMPGQHVLRKPSDPKEQ